MACVSRDRLRPGAFNGYITVTTNVSSQGDIFCCLYYWRGVMQINLCRCVMSILAICHVGYFQSFLSLYFTYARTPEALLGYWALYCSDNAG